MKCYECGGVLVQTKGLVRMTKKDGGLIFFKEVPLSQCQQCGEQYIQGNWSEKIGLMMSHENELVPQEILSVPVVSMS